MEEDVKFIDAKNILKPHHMQSFLDLCSDEEQITVVVSTDENFILTITKSEIVKSLFNKSLVEVAKTENDVVTYVAKQAVFEITGHDVTWWNTNTRRKNKMINGCSTYHKEELQDSQIEKPSSLETIRVGIATLTEEGLTDLVVSDGSKQAMVLWMNHHLVQRHILPKDQFVVFCLDYKDGDENNIELWKSLADLVAEKKIIMM